MASLNLEAIAKLIDKKRALAKGEAEYMEDRARLKGGDRAMNESLLASRAQYVVELIKEIQRLEKEITEED